eukprot:jgi/Tetstr1/464807/TSEL_009546.t1
MDLKPSSGKTYDDIKAAAKQLYWEAYNNGRSGLRGKPMPMGWSDHTWGCFILFGPLPGGNKNAPGFGFNAFSSQGPFLVERTHMMDFGFNCFSSQGGAATQSSRAAHREMNSCHKKARRDEERKQAAKEVVEQHSQSISKQAAATADALNMNNAIWAIELMLKHGDEQQKAEALELVAKNMEEAMPTPLQSTMTKALSTG